MHIYAGWCFYRNESPNDSPILVSVTSVSDDEIGVDNPVKCVEWEHYSEPDVMIDITIEPSQSESEMVITEAFRGSSNEDQSFILQSIKIGALWKVMIKR
eukprot:937545_1